MNCFQIAGALYSSVSRIREEVQKKSLIRKTLNRSYEYVQRKNRTLFSNILMRHVTIRKSALTKMHSIGSPKYCLAKAIALAAKIPVLVTQ